MWKLKHELDTESKELKTAQKDFESEKKRLMTEMESFVAKEWEKFEKQRKVFEW